LQGRQGLADQRLLTALTKAVPLVARRTQACLADGSGKQNSEIRDRSDCNASPPRLTVR